MLIKVNPDNLESVLNLADVLTGKRCAGSQFVAQRPDHLARPRAQRRQPVAATPTCGGGSLRGRDRGVEGGGPVAPPRMMGWIAATFILLAAPVYAHVGAETELQLWFKSLHNGRGPFADMQTATSYWTLEISERSLRRSY